MTDPINPRDVPPMSAQRANMLSNRVIGEFEGRPWRTTKTPDGEVEPPYSPSLEDVLALLSAVHELEKFKGRDERTWHEELFRKLNAGFFKDDARVMQAELVKVTASLLTDRAQNVLTGLVEGLPISDTDLTDLQDIIDKYRASTERNLSRPPPTFIELLNELIAYEEVRQGASTGEHIGEESRKKMMESVDWDLVNRKLEAQRERQERESAK